MRLNQEKLNVVNKTQSNPFNWKGQFTPDLVSYLLSEYALPGSLVVDTFSGSGTVLIESIKRDCNCVGFDINPTAFYMSKFYEYSSLTKEERNIYMDEIRSLIGHKIMSLPENLPIYIADTDYRKAYINLLNIACWFASHVDIKYWPFLINVLFLCEKDKKQMLKQSLITNINKIKDFFFQLPYTSVNINAKNEDARNISKYFNDNVDLIITSPPYINVFNYHQNYRGIIECFDYNILNVANSEIGSNRKHRSNRYKTVVQYTVDMGHVLLESSKSLKVNGRMIYIVGRESNVRKTPFYNSKIICDLIDKIPSIQIEEQNSRCFTNRYGEIIYEDVIVIRKLCSSLDENLTKSFMEVGLKHLSNALDYSPIETKDDIKAIIYGYDKVYESPILA